MVMPVTWCYTRNIVRKKVELACTRTPIFMMNTPLRELLPLSNPYLGIEPIDINQVDAVCSSRTSFEFWLRGALFLMTID